MADKRINALTTTSASVGDDYFAIDGATNGTRALSAFSPTFGGNVVVTGTLTANGGATVGGGSFAAASFYKSSSLGSVLSGATGSSYDLYITNPAGNYILQVPTGTRNAEFAGTLTTVGNATVGAALTVQATTASTTTSTGALVVGNGTSGGLGVGGAIVAGGTITSTASTDSGLLQLNLVNSSTGTSASSLFRFNAGTRTATLQAYNDTHATLAGQLRIATSNGDIGIIPSGVLAATFGSNSITLTGEYLHGSNTNFNITSTATNGNVYIKSNGGTLYLNNTAGNGDIRLGNTGTVAYVIGTASSSTTSSGALVVSGGVGVAGNTVVGGASFTTGDGSSGPYLASSSVIDHSSGQARFYGRGANTSTRATLGFYSTYSDGTGGITLQTFDVSGNATFGASIKTSAPSGGTAAAWKLGTVASVSPTSPNRTIEVDIGGTIYYIHAKTTNN